MTEAKDINDERLADAILDVFTAERGYIHESVWLDLDVRVSPDSHPACIDLDEFDCHICEFFGPSTCPLLRDADLRDDIRSLLKLYSERRSSYEARRWTLINAIYSELRAYGRPLHYSVLAQMVEHRYPKLHVSENSVLRIMTWNPDYFECTAPGVYMHCSKIVR